MTEEVPGMPRYRCHKEVWALKVANIIIHDDHHELIFEDTRYAPIDVSIDWLLARSVGGYYVVYQDGYTSYSPADAFEEGYTLIEA